MIQILVSYVKFLIYFLWDTEPYMLTLFLFLKESHTLKSTVWKKISLYNSK